MSCFAEYDPRDTAYIALFVAVIWYTEITPEQARRLAEGKSFMKPENKLTPETMEKASKIIRNPNFKNFNNIERRFRINRYRIFEELQRQKRN